MVIHKWKQLQNGIDIVSVPTNNKYVFYISYIIRHGHLNEVNGNYDYTHLIEHILASFVNKSMCKRHDINSKLSDFVYSSNAYTNDHEMGVWIEGEPKDMELYIKLLSQSLFNLCFDKKELEIHKNNVIQELHQDDDFYHYVAFNKHLRNRITSNQLSINDIKKVTVDIIEDFYKMLLSQPIVVSFVCNHAYMRKGLSMIEKEFNVPRSFTQQVNPIPPVVIHEKTIKCYKPIQSVQCKICMKIDMDIHSIEHAALQILMNYIFDFDEGVMYKELRHKYGYIYSINWSMSIDRYRNQNNILTITTFFDKKNTKKVLDIFDSLIDSLDISIYMFDLFRRQTVFNLSYDKMNSINSFANFYAKQYLYREKPISYTKYIELFKKVKYEDVRKMLKQIKNNTRTTFLYHEKYD